MVCRPIRAERPGCPGHAPGPGRTVSDDRRLYAPSAPRNREPILQVLRQHLPPAGTVLEVASGTGEHVAYFAAALPGVTWQPTDPDAERRDSIAAWTRELPNVRPPLDLDAVEGPWPAGPVDAVLCINMIHIAPPAATNGLIAGAAATLGVGGSLILYGPFRRAGSVMQPGNAAFDADLRARNPAWGLRMLDDVARLAAAARFGPPVVEPMPADNLTVVFRRAASRATG